MTEDWPVRPAEHLFYAQEKADLESRLREESTKYPGIGLYLLRPPIVLGPNMVGAKQWVPEALTPLSHGLGVVLRHVPLPFPVAMPAAPVEAAARLIAALPEFPFLPPLMEWAEAFSHPSVMDTSKAERELGWKPRYTSIEALRTAVERWSRS